MCACEPAEQIRRLMARDRLTIVEARARLAAQWPIEEKVARAHYVIRTDGTIGRDRRGGQGGVRQVEGGPLNPSAGFSS